MVETKINKDNKKINITAYHPEFKKLNDNQRINITFILLDESLGEDTTEVRIGEIYTSDTKLENNPIAITKLKNYIDNVVEDNRWDPLLTPDKIWNSYSIKPIEKPEYSPREDIIAGSTMNINTVKNYMKYDLLKGTGSDYIFLMFSNDDFDTNTIVKQRGKIEDILDDKLRKNKQGFLIGGATGINNLYIDLIIFDKKNSIDTIKKTMNKNFGDIEGSIHYFPGIKQNEVFYF